MEFTVKTKIADLTEQERMEHQKEVAAVLLNIKRKEKEGKENERVG